MNLRQGQSKGSGLDQDNKAQVTIQSIALKNVKTA